MTPAVIAQLKSDPEILLYGASSSGARMYYNLLHLFASPEKISFYDSNKAKQGATFLDRPVLTQAQFESLGRNMLILISSTMFYEIVPQLRQQGFTNCHYVHDLLFSKKQY